MVLNRCYHVTHTVTPAGAKVEGLALFAIGKMPECKNMCLGQILNMDVIANGCAIRGGVICSEDAYLGAIAPCRLDHEGNEVGLRVVRPSDLCLRQIRPH